MEKTGSTIKHLRTFNNLTQDQFAQKIGVSRAQIISYENGKNLPSLEVIKKIADYFEVTIDAIVSGDIDFSTANGVLVINDDPREDYKNKAEYVRQLEYTVSVQKDLIEELKEKLKQKSSN